MQPNPAMAKSTLKILEDLQHVQQLLSLVASQLNTLAKRAHKPSLLLRAKERIVEAEARLDGVQAFVAECQKSVDREASPKEKEFDVWV